MFSMTLTLTSYAQTTQAIDPDCLPQKATTHKHIAHKPNKKKTEELNLEGKNRLLFTIMFRLLNLINVLNLLNAVFLYPQKRKPAQQSVVRKTAVAVAVERLMIVAIILS